MKTLEEAIAAIEDLKAAHEAEKASILKLNKELVAKEKAAKTAQAEAEQIAEDAKASVAEKAGDTEAVKAATQKKHDAEIKALNERYASLEAAHSTLTIDNVISAAISAAGVQPDLVEMLTDGLKSKAKMVDGVAMAGDVPLTDHLGTFFKSPAAKAFLVAPHNSGGGALGSSAKADPHGFTLENYKARAVELAMLEKSDPAQHAAIKQSLGLA